MAKQEKHSERAHALLAASHASRWMNCPPSARLEEAWEAEHPSESSVYAEEGTLAHEMAEALLKAEVEGKEFDMSKFEENPLFSDDMYDYVSDYVRYVLDVFAEVKEKTPDAILIVEKRLDFSHVVKDGFGTGDVCIIADDFLHIIDLKFGKGVKVEAQKNSQLMLYAIGALREFDIMYDIHRIALHIVQPRIHNFSSWETSVEELYQWSENEVKPAAKKAYDGKGVQKAGSHCKFCKVKSVCATLASNSLALSKLGMKNPHLLTEKQLMEAYEKIPSLIEWANSVNEYVLKQAVSGNVPKGYKVVEGTSRRKWADEDKVRETLKEEGFEESQYMKKTLKGIGDIEKLVGKKVFPDMFGDLVTKSPGSPTLVKEDDPRPQMQSIEQAKSDFSS